jgi:hypothetical protein
LKKDALEVLCNMNQSKHEIFVDGLPLPARLLVLIEKGLWPQSEAESLRQNLHSLVPTERIQLFAPEESSIYLAKPPFYTVARARIGGQVRFWSTFAAPEGISPELSVVIGDFGMGSDSPILLDYRQDRSNPAVIRLKWQKSPGLSNVWVRCADTFDEFADMLGLDENGRSS